MKQRIKRPFYEGEPPYWWLWMGRMPTSKRKMSRKRWKQLKMFDKLTNESIGVWERRAFSVHIQQKEALSFERTSSKVVPDGLEPPLTEPKTVVLPLHHGTINGCKGTCFRACHQILTQLFMLNGQKNVEVGVKRTSKVEKVKRWKGKKMAAHQSC